MKGFLIGVVLAFFALGPRVSVPVLGFQPGGMINQAAINSPTTANITGRQDSQPQWWEIWKMKAADSAPTTNPNSGAGAIGCYPDPQNPRYKCIPRDRNGNAGQLGSVIPDDYQGLPSSGFFESGRTSGR